ncbi:MAG TPA: TOBE domain-containing protein, partial [Solirubrobacteraceae bacterium]|nr:TOBE domain-containing protein [Solirubrobacteraceae bacterium]
IGDSGEVQILGHRVAVANPEGYVGGGAVDALLRPESIAVVRDTAGPGEITDRTFLGSVTRLEVTLDSGQKVLVDAHGHGADSPEPGERVALQILAQSVTVTAADTREPELAASEHA